MSPTKSPKWLDYSAAAARAGVTERALHRAVSMRKVEVVRLGRATLFAPEAIDRWIAASTQPAVAS